MSWIRALGPAATLALAAVPGRRRERRWRCFGLCCEDSSAAATLVSAAVGAAGLDATSKRWESTLPLYTRSWITHKAAPEAQGTAPLRLHVMQFNVLADGLSGKDSKAGGFTESPRDSLDFSYRGPRLIEEMLRHGEGGGALLLPDVIAMQEVDHYYDWFEPVLRQLGYEGRFLKKPESGCKWSLDPSLEDGCALFWRKQVLEEAHAPAFLNYDKLQPNGAPTGKKSNQVALVVTLKPVQQPDASFQDPIAFAVTHLMAAKSPEGERGRAQQVRQLLDWLQGNGRPCVLAMDMNGAPEQSSVANYPSEAYPVMMQHPLAVRSAYREVLGKEPAYTTWKRRGVKEAMHTIDYIVYSGPVTVRRILSTPAPADVDITRFPGWRYPSDHTALLTELEFW